MDKPIIRRWRKLRGDDKGASAVEFAIIAPVFITLIMGIVELSLILFTYATAGYATRDVSRRIATNRLAAASASATLKPQLPAWVQAAATVTVTQTTPATPATNVITVAVSMPLANATPTTYLSAIYGTKAMQASTTMQQEN